MVTRTVGSVMRLRSFSFFEVRDALEEAVEEYRGESPVEVGENRRASAVAVEWSGMEFSAIEIIHGFVASLEFAKHG